MLASEIIDDIKIEIQQTSEERFTNANLLDIVNEGYIDFCRYTEILEKQTTQVLSSLDTVVSLPDDFLESRQFRWSYNRQLYPYSERRMDYDQRDWVWEASENPQNVVYLNWGSVRVKPIPTAAGTIMFRYAYIPDPLASTDSPNFLKMFHQTLVIFGAAECFYIMRDYENANLNWIEYMARREKAKIQARQYQRGPDVMMTQRSVTVFNWPYWDSRFRNRS